LPRRGHHLPGKGPHAQEAQRRTHLRDPAGGRPLRAGRLRLAAAAGPGRLQATGTAQGQPAGDVDSALVDGPAAAAALTALFGSAVETALSPSGKPYSPADHG